VLLLIYGSLFLSGIDYCLRVFWCAAARMSELEFEQRTNIKLVQVYEDNAMKKTVVYKCMKGFLREEKVPLTKRDQDG
jgi:hypothetical protein